MEEILIEKKVLKEVEGLPSELIEEVIDFIEFLKAKKIKKEKGDDSYLLLQQENLKKIWDAEGEDLIQYNQTTRGGAKDEKTLQGCCAR